MMRKLYLPLAAMMLLCLAPMPYGYFQLVRFLSTIAFGMMAYRYYMEKKDSLTYTCGVLALLCQPFYKIALGRTVWNVVDVIVAIGLIILFFYEMRIGSGNLKEKEPIPPINIIGEPIENNSIEFTFQGRLGPKELVYIASEEDKTLTELFETRPEVLEGWGQMIGFHIIYLPLLLKKLRDKRVLQYRAPYLNDVELSEISIGNDFLLQYLEHPSDREKIKQGFIRTEDIHRGNDGKDKATNRFYPLSSKSGEPLADQLHRIGKQISFEKEQHDRYLEGNAQYYDEWGDAESPSANFADDSFSPEEQEETVNELMDEVRERISKLRQRGIAEYILEQLIHPDNRLSRLVIKKDWRILLPDYNNMEIKMEPLVKAVYLLFLRHPEGIAFKQLPDYREELTRTYYQLKPSGLTDRAMQSIEDVTNPMLNSINEKCARIRAAFIGQFDEYMAKSYYIDGLRGEVKKIALPRNLVTWE
ncbi:MAG: hypothetical protein IJ618_10205 [Prevotella sp.]|nr:hypothetical protein [Prevotella sp.]